ncbi:hypothetical protein I4U23_014638 [Adineta vaga]|nr:hypothetical protein I4U23_014638 [Adineta vaga]
MSMSEKGKFLDRIMSKRGLTKFDTTFLTNDGGKYSPSIRRLRQQYLPNAKIIPGKMNSSSPQPLTKINSIHHQSSLDLMAVPLKCDDCQKHDGLFQCCHCSQRLCIRCCNKHYKKVTAELEYLHELSDCLLTKILHTKTDLERHKDEAIEQCQQWRIDTINTINKAHTSIIQTIHDEYEILGKEYDSFVEKEMLHINMDKNELIRMKKGNLGSLLSSPSSSSITNSTDPTKSIDRIKKRIETLANYIDDARKFSFQVKLPTFIIDETLRVESRFGDTTRSTNATWLNDDFIHETSKQMINSSHLDISSTASSSSTSLTETQMDRRDSTSSSNDSAYYNQDEDSSPKSTDETYHSVQHVQLKREEDGSSKGLSIQFEKSHHNDGIIDQRRTCMEAIGMRRNLTNQGRSSNDYPWVYYQTDLSPSYIQ